MSLEIHVKIKLFKILKSNKQFTWQQTQRKTNIEDDDGHNKSGYNLTKI